MQQNLSLRSRNQFNNSAAEQTQKPAMSTTTTNAIKPESLANLKSKLAPDAPGLTAANSKPVSVRLHVNDIAAIAELDGDRSYHIRQAVKAYLRDWNNLKASSLAQAQTQESLPEEYDPGGWNNGESDSDWSDRVERGEYDPITDTVFSN